MPLHFQEPARQVRVAAAPLFAAASLLLANLAADGQTGPVPLPADLVVESLRLRDLEDYAAAIRLLERYVADRPGDLDARLILARTLYWSGNASAARLRYEEALTQFPHHSTLRLEYGRMLTELNASREARRVLSPLREDPSMAAEVETLLGQLAYWAGDLSAAAAHFRTALRLDPLHPAARSLGDEIRLASAPTFYLESSCQRDSQPIERLRLTTGAIWFITPLQTLAIEAQPRRLEFASGTTYVTALHATAGGYWPRFGLESLASIGLLDQSISQKTDWTGRAVLGLRLPAGARLQGIAERAPYHHTEASLSVPVMMTRLQGVLALRAAAGWLGEASFQAQHFADANVILGFHAWLLAPVYRVEEWHVLAGYAFSYRDSSESRFLPTDPTPRPEAIDLAGKYVPYHTPENTRVHSLSAAFSFRLTPRTAFNANGSYGLVASEDAPYFSTAVDSGAADGEPQLAFYRRRFNPYEASGTLAAAVSPALNLHLRAGAVRTQYWNALQIEAGISYRHHGRPLALPVPQ